MSTAATRSRFSTYEYRCKGVHPKIVSEMLGYSSIALTLDTYSHVLPDMQDDAAARMEALLGRASAS